MRIKDVKLYINPGATQQWQMSSQGRGGIEPVPPRCGMRRNSLPHRLPTCCAWVFQIAAVSPM